MKNASKKKRYYFLMLRDMKLKSSKRKREFIGSFNKFKGISMDFDELTIIVGGAHCNDNLEE